MKRRRLIKKRWIRLGWPFLVLFVLSIIIIRERSGIAVEDEVTSAMKNFDARLYEVSDAEFTDTFEQDVECMILSDSRDLQSNVTLEQMQAVLDDMKIGYDIVDLAKVEFPDLSEYTKIVVTTSDLSAMENNVLVLCEWVKNGGELMNTGTFQNDAYFQIIGPKVGILNMGGSSSSTVSGMRILNDFMLNAHGREFFYDEPTETAMGVSLVPECQVYVEDPVSDVPLLWEYEYGEGKFIINNQVLTGKISRGLLCASYSLMGDTCAYPVINASTFYIDDFPSPVPSGEGKYISEQYGVSIATFYSNIWWPDMINLAEEYGIIHTGLIIVDYSDQVEGVFEEYESKERFTFFGNMLLNNGGELGFHGYNHMPLTLDNYDYMGLYDEYEHWPSTEEMGKAITTLRTFSEGLFPDARFSVYVPPSNILSQEGREALKENWDDLLVIASTYNVDDVEYTQEFEVAEDGIIETPRITSGCELGEYMTLAAFSELTFHYVQSHFLHPDDVLDEERGAAIGWETMYNNLKNYTHYIYSAAPNIRNVSGSGMGEAVREFDKLSVKRVESKNNLNLTLGGFYKEAYIMVRINEGEPTEVAGGTIENISGNLYLLHATSSEVNIKLQ